MWWVCRWPDFAPIDSDKSDNSDSPPSVQEQEKDDEPVASGSDIVTRDDDATSGECSILNFQWN